ncbi:MULTISPECIES: diguanylate cyclase [unclassified Pseudoalteromonas]|jgi:diguanylate cyclase (GGDEF)-like protein|uniref:diguanylate cyclase n=1 Tax=unclassified Pseudoalteromonas TaxID=194690 RepID=UPI0014089F94|nr:MULTISPECIES: diguanylate cyclase [unclassified Pseudoalteromonas]MCF2846303.1 diguanylate cyclase [Pseudoalteromonas sp. PAST1]MCF2917588.1 diguanylate cyclase [Pseudoalteromonas sp. Cn5-37]NHH87764.1 Diguanylate cyclase YdeH [Pseudoalteromonas sp. MB47]
MHQINRQGISSLSNTQLEDVIAEIEQAIEWHQSWYKNLLRCLIADTPANEQDLADNAHNFCRFGQWFNKLPDQTIKLHPHFSEIASAHKKMHQGAKVLLSLKESKTVIPVNLLDQFHADLDRLRELFDCLIDEFTEVLHTRDPLTGASNRTNLLENLQKEHELCKRKSLSCALIMIDLDHFKQVNDEFGHAAGDKVLIALVKCIKSQLRKYDQLYRYGGEEFLVCLPQTELDDAKSFSERLRAGVEALKIDISNDNHINVTGSFGVTLINADDNIETAIERADEAMYQAKKSGRNRVCVA